MKKRSLTDLYRTDPDVEKHGVWWDSGAGQFRIRRAGGDNVKYKRRLESLFKPYRRAIANNLMPEDKADELLRQLYAETIVTDWDEEVANTVSPSTGKLYGPYTVEACLLLWKDLPALWEDHKAIANELAVYRKDLLEEESGN